MSAHTPGPWIIYWRQGKSEMKGGPGSVQAVSGGKIARVFARTEDEGAQGANARLIAAAPDLLAALEAMMFDCPDSYPVYAAVKRARAAIAKARGVR